MGHEWATDGANRAQSAAQSGARALAARPALYRVHNRSAVVTPIRWGLPRARASQLAARARAQLLLDMLVLPSNPITDYNERWSGINAQMLAPVKATIADAQAVSPWKPPLIVSE